MGRDLQLRVWGLGLRVWGCWGTLGLRFRPFGVWGSAEGLGI